MTGEMEFSTSQSRQEPFSIGEISAVTEQYLHVYDEIPDSQDGEDIIMSSPDDEQDAYVNEDCIMKSFVEMSAKLLEASNAMRDAVDKISATFNDSVHELSGNVQKALAAVSESIDPASFTRRDKVPDSLEGSEVNTAHKDESICSYDEILDDDKEYTSVEDVTDEEYVDYEWGDDEYLSDGESEADDTDVEDESIPLIDSFEEASDNEMEWESELTRPALWSKDAPGSSRDNQFVELSRPALWSIDEKLDMDGLAYGETGNGSLRQGLLYNLLENLIQWGKTDAEPAASGFRVLLNQLDIEWTVNEYLAGIPEKVQQLFEKECWSSGDLMALDDASSCEHGGVYLHIFPHEHRGQLRLMAYVGYSRSLQGRVEAHQKVRQGRRKYQRTQHYVHFLHSDYNASEFKILAILDKDLPTKYYVLLESLFQILLQTVSFPGFTTRFCTQAMYDAARNFGESINCSSSLFGLNMALSVFQSIPHDWSHLDLPCKNCKDMTFVKKYRILFDPQDPSKGYHCGRCGKYRNANGFPPHAKSIKRRQLYKAAHERKAFITACETCYKPLARSRRCVSLDGVVCCQKCYTFFNTHGIHSTPETRHEAFDLSGYLTCEACATPFSDAYSSKRRTSDGTVCCQRCQTFYFDEGRHRTSPEIEHLRVFRSKISVFAAAHPNCEVCNRDLTKGNIGRSQAGDKVTCRSCAHFYKENRRHRDKKEVSDITEMRELRNRYAATQACENCKTNFAITGSKSMRCYADEKIVCRLCYQDYRKDGILPPADKERRSFLPADLHICQHCKHPFTGQKGRIRHKRTGKVICSRCYRWTRTHADQLPPADWSIIRRISKDISNCENCNRPIMNGKRYRHQPTGKIICSTCFAWSLRHERRLPTKPIETETRLPTDIPNCQHCNRPFTGGRRNRHGPSGKIICNGCYAWSLRNEKKLPPPDKRHRDRIPADILNCQHCDKPFNGE